MYTDFEESLSSPVLSLCSSSSGWTGVGLEERTHKDAPHPLSLRPWDITVLINLHKVHGRLPTVSKIHTFMNSRLSPLLVRPWKLLVFFIHLCLFLYLCVTALQQ